MENTYKVPEKNLETLRQRMDKLARRCKRIGIAEPVMKIGEATDIRFTDESGIDQIRRVYAVTLSSSERPCIEGYEFIAVLSPVVDDSGKPLGNILRAVPGASVTPEERFRSASNYCDHCKTDRFRLETFVIFDGTTQRQIGRNCLANYLGLTNPHMLAARAECLLNLVDLGSMAEDDSFGGVGHTATRHPLDTILELAAAAIRNYGWLSGQSARTFDKISTADRVRSWVFGTAKDRERFEFPLTPNEADQKLAAETQEWLNTLSVHTQDDYRYNLALLAQSVSVVGKNFGLAVSAINAYSREKEREIRRNARLEADKNSQFVGTVGERMTFENLTVVYTMNFETDFGVTHLYKMKSGDNVVVYFSSRNLEFEIGTVIPKFIATIKKHEVREELGEPVRQTIITRGKVAPRDLSKTEKQGIAKLKRVIKAIDSNEMFGYLAANTLQILIEDIKQNGIEISA